MEHIVDQYCIKSMDSDYWIIEDKFQCVSFWIEKTKERTILRRLSNKNIEMVDVVIPRRFPSGHRIDFLDSNFLQGKFGKITISKGIKVNNRAFAYSNVEEVIWPDDCTCIPCSCFYKSKISKISNIDNVVKVGSEAFSGSGIKKMSWPTQCPHIPARCFYRSMLEEINNLANVEWIGKTAFMETNLNSLNLIDTNISYLEESSLLGLPRGCNIILPYYVSQEEVKKAKS